MSVRVEFKQQPNCYTNFDLLEGRVLLSIVQQETIAAITVKLEGESRTRLAGQIPRRGQYDGYQSDQTQLEVHKVCLFCPIIIQLLSMLIAHSSSIMSKSSSLPQI